MGIYIKRNGAWTTADKSYVKVGGVWKTIDIFSIRANGAWKSSLKPSEGLEFMATTGANNSIEYWVSGIGTCTDTKIVIPSEHNGRPVTGIYRDAFSYQSTITSVTIPNGVTSIGNNTFNYCSNLANVNIPNGVTYIGLGAFGYCSKLTTIIIPSSVTKIGSGAFGNCTNLTIYCEAESQPSGWNSNWNRSNRPVVWGYGSESEHTHSYTSEITTAPTCTTSGIRTYTCSGCGESYTEYIAPTGHTDSNGDNYCDVCGAYIEPDHTHNYTSVVTAPTCTEQGYTTYTCSGCGDKYMANYTDALGHSEITFYSVAPDSFGAGTGAYVYFETNLKHDETSVALQVCYAASDDFVVAEVIPLSVDGSGTYTITVDAIGTYDVKLQPMCCEDAEWITIGSFTRDSDGHYE